jgi:hypothetical protein
MDLECSFQTLDDTRIYIFCRFIHRTYSTSGVLVCEPSISHYSNPVFLVHKPPLRDGSPGGLRFVWDGRSVNRAIKADSFLIPRVVDLIERIARL